MTVTLARPATRIERLSRYLWMNQRKRFSLGAHDCATFVARWVDEEAGTNCTAKLIQLGRSTSMPKLLRQLRQVGGYQRLVEELTGVAGTFEAPWRAGDVCVFVGDNDRQTLGILSSRLIHAPGESGLAATDASRRICHWSPECLR